MSYLITAESGYDFKGESYGESPNLHAYPATMIPQIGVKILQELDLRKGQMLDPYCGSGSSFVSGLHCGLDEFTGFDLNPLAIIISKTRFTHIKLKELNQSVEKIKDLIRKDIFTAFNEPEIEINEMNNSHYWFKPRVARDLQLLKNVIKTIRNEDIKNFFLLAFSSSIRECSYVRNNEFKLYRMKEEAILAFNPDVFGIFFDNLDKAINIYTEYYHDLIENVNLSLHNKSFKSSNKKFDVVLTSPPYGDSRTTVAYGQFSTFANTWVCGMKNARSLDKHLMGGAINREKQIDGIMLSYIKEIEQIDIKRAAEVNSFYVDLAESICNVSASIKKGGYSIYVVGNRTVKGIQLPTDQFIAEQFERNGLRHLVTYERNIGNKRMPKLNSPTNQSGKKMATMSKEYIIICQN